MTDTTRYRVTGAVFLIAVGVIFLPMLFDGAGLESPPMDPLDGEPSAVAEVAAPVLDEDGLAEADEMRARLDDAAFDRRTGSRLGDPQLTDADSKSKVPVESWAVQLASFSDRDKAVALRDRLHRDGYASLLSDVKRVAGVSTRVAVGPVMQRAEADRLAAELSKRYDTDTLVVRFDQ